MHPRPSQKLRGWHPCDCLKWLVLVWMRQPGLVPFFAQHILHPLQVGDTILYSKFGLGVTDIEVRCLACSSFGCCWIWYTEGANGCAAP